MLRSQGFKKRSIEETPEYPRHDCEDGVGPLLEMPQICVGTAQYDRESPRSIKRVLANALAEGYRHIDGAEAYGGTDFRRAVGEALATSGIVRHEIWITWKSDSITPEGISTQIADLGCGYIDLFLVHHGCGTPKDFLALQAAMVAGQIRRFGVSNCWSVETLRKLKATYGIFANQIQAVLPGGRIENQDRRPDRFIEVCNELDIAVMLYATISGTSNALIELMEDPKLFEHSMHLTSYIPKLNRYYTQTYIIGTRNVLMVGSLSGSSLGINMREFKNTLNGIDILNKKEMKEISDELKPVVIQAMN